MNPLKKLSRLDFKELVPTKRGESNSKVKIAQAFLIEQGLLNAADVEPDVLGHPTAKAIEDYQSQYGLPPTGDLDEPTIEVMALPRCAMREGSLSLAVECRWPVNGLQYAFENFTPDVPQSAVQAALARAFSTWTAECGVTFTQVDAAQPHNISIAWRSAFDSDYDLVGADVAHADYPGACSEVNPGGVTPLHFDGSECGWTDDGLWERDDTLVVPVYDIETVALHEIGHILGLRHSPIPGDVLYGAVPKKAKRVLAPNDVLRIKFLYGIP